jgi:hypothetical protein
MQSPVYREAQQQEFSSRDKKILARENWAGRDDKFIAGNPERLNCRFASALKALGMTKGRTALSLNLVVPPTIPMDVVHFSLNLPQAS